MTTVTLPIPDDLVPDLEATGLLRPEAAGTLGKIFRDGLRRYMADDRSHVAPRFPVVPEAPATMKENRPDVDAERVEMTGAETPKDGWMEGALEELGAMDEEAAEEDLPPVSEVARSEARRLLHALGGQPVAPMICPTEDGEVSLYFKNPDVRGALHILLDRDGSGAWFSLIPGKNGYGRYRDARELPLDFLRARLRSLAAQPARS